MHALSNVASVSASSARILARKSDDPLVLQIAAELEASSARAHKALLELEAVLMPRDEG